MSANLDPNARRYSICRDDALCSGEFRVWDTEAIITRSVHKTRRQAEAAVRRYEAEDAKRRAA